ncbi:MAG: HAD-IIIA family hydrolase [Deltaproteobacteria bacterium]|jgi:D-glycero-D-manno-heptose 1,7-bisphosphate phosphatase|nr:HAD-IIIA family hydrolase [Deltaproteobacteria bacterium]
MTAARRGVFLDRDGVLNKALVVDGLPFGPIDADALELTEGAPELLAELKERGFVLVCVTNQPDVARGTRTLENVLAMNEKVKTLLPLDALYACLHDNHHNCDCRKPKPGMLLRGAKEFGLDLSKSFMVGDRAGDIEAGRRAGTYTIFIDHGYKEKLPDPEADHTCKSLGEAVGHILEREEPE